MRVLAWHVHGSWATSFVQGPWTTLLPVDADRSADGLGRARTWTWPERAVEVDLAALADDPPDAVLLQRPHEEDLLREATGLRAGLDLPAVYVEHNTPKGDVPLTRHPAADRDDLLLVHVTRTNALLWDAGTTATEVVEHGVAVPEHRWSGELARVAVVLNEPVRRGRVTGTDLLPGLAAVAPLDVFGMRVEALAGRLDGDVGLHEDLPQHRMHAEVARRGAYAHPLRWTSLGLSLLEAMAMGVPCTALAMTGAHEAVAPGTALLAWSGRELAEQAALLLRDRELAAEVGAAGAERVRERYGVDRFVRDWSDLLADVTGTSPRTSSRTSSRTSTAGSSSGPSPTSHVPEGALP